MSRKENQKIKLLCLLRFLQEKSDEAHPVSVADMIAHLSSLGIAAERKSIYSDIEALREYGEDIITVRGKTTGYYLGARTFETAELKLLVDAVQSSRFITRKKSDELISKLAKDAGVYTASSLKRQVRVHNRVKTMNESIYYTVDVIHTALSEKKKLSFLYYEWNGKKEKVLRHAGERYEISPFALSWQEENYYLIAYDERAEGIKHYRVDKMIDARVVPKKREGEEAFKDFDAGQYAKSVFGMYGGREEAVTLRCHSSLAGVVLDKFGQDVTFFPENEDFFQIHVRVHISPTFFSWVFGFGDKMKILSPDAVLKEFCQMAEEVLKQYNKN
ncbi:MAG: WYL domain-containing protein [Clostridia bacterium]|nr:WYL domain-containing protein [Clostridia bacterium]